MIVLFNKYKIFLIELIINFFSFSIFILAQQIIALPILSRFYQPSEFGTIVILLGISGIITSMFGYSIGNGRLFNKKYYNKKFVKIFYISNFIVMGISSTSYFYFTSSYFESLIFTCLCLLGNIRNFLQSEYRLNNTHDYLFKQNLWYFFGLLIGILFFFIFEKWVIIFLFAEMISVSLSYCFLHKGIFFRLFKDDSKLSLTNTFQLIINNGASYSLAQYDRFIIYPILGSTNVSLYYSASVSTKIGGLIMNPLSSYILGKMATKEVENNNEPIRLSIICSFLIIIFYFILSLITTPILVKILYPSYFSMIGDIFIFICLGAAFMSGTSILKPITMKYIGVKFYNKIFFIYGGILVSLSIVLCLNYNLVGLAIANLISSFILYILILVVNIKKYSH